MSTQQALDNMRELARLRAKIEALETTVKLGTVEFVLEDAIKAQQAKTKKVVRKKVTRRA